MRRCCSVLVLALTAAALAAPGQTTPQKDAPKKDGKDAPKVTEGLGLRLRPEEIDRSLKVGYAVILADVNTDAKPDIVVVDTDRVLWYENPTWKRRTLIAGRTKPDNVCIAAADIDGDGQLDFALGAGWQPFDTRTGGTLQWLKRGKTLDEPWTLYPIAEEPTLHRIRFADLDGDGKPELVVVPLHGRDSTRGANWIDGKPVRILAFKVPADPVKGPWEPTVINESLHVVHNFHPIPAAGRKGSDILTASYEGVSLLSREPSGRWGLRRLGEGNQNNPLASRGSSEIKQGTLRGERKFIATIEPWHGNQVVVYTPPDVPDEKTQWERRVVDLLLRWGHAVWCADLDRDGDEELIVGVRDNPGRGDDFKLQRGVRVYKSGDGFGRRWERLMVDPDGVAVEDLAAADLNGDGRPEIVAVGRATANVRIYWNEK
jgi:hypothetical protein